MRLCVSPPVFSSSAADVTSFGETRVQQRQQTGLVPKQESRANKPVFCPHLQYKSVFEVSFVFFHKKKSSSTSRSSETLRKTKHFLRKEFSANLHRLIEITEPLSSSCTDQMLCVGNQTLVFAWFQLLAFFSCCRRSSHF